MPCRLATPLYTMGPRGQGRAGTTAPALSPVCMGWVKGLEPSTPGTTIRCSNQLSYTHHIRAGQSRSLRRQRNTCENGPALTVMVRLKGLEPLAHCLEGSCSIHLSYRRISNALYTKGLRSVRAPGRVWSG